MSEDRGNILINLRKQAERLRRLVDQKRLDIEAAKVSRDISLLNRELTLDTTTKAITKQITHQTEFFAPAGTDAGAAAEVYQDRVFEGRAAGQAASSETEEEYRDRITREMAAGQKTTYFPVQLRVQGPTGPDLTSPSVPEGYTLEGPYWNPTIPADVGAKEGDTTYLISDYPEPGGPKTPLARGFWLLRASPEGAAALKARMLAARERVSTQRFG